jgi:hypothetical protein
MGNKLILPGAELLGDENIKCFGVSSATFNSELVWIVVLLLLLCGCLSHNETAFTSVVQRLCVAI